MSEVTKVYEFAKQIGMETLALMDKIRSWDLPVKSHMASLDEGLIDEINRRLEDESSSKKVKKKAAKKKVAKKSVAKKSVAKKKVAKKAVTKKKTVVKKTITKKVTKKVAAKVAVVEETAQKKTVIRRKASAIQEKEERLALEAKQREEAALSQPEVTTEESTEASESGSAKKTAIPKMGRSIVGKIDLPTVSTPARTHNRPGAAGASSALPPKMGVAPASRTNVRGNIRTGFVAPTTSTASEEEKRREERKRRAGKEERVTKTFTSSDFKKREVIFQPKKKRVVLRGDSKKTQLTTPKASKRVVKMYEDISVSDLALQLKIKAPQLIKALVKNGEMANMNSMLDFDTVSLIVSEFGFEAETLFKTEEDMAQTVAFGDLEAEKIARPPVVTVMGHVDHGKTTLLDSIRKADVASAEAGGITQHIGAYEVKTEIGDVTFIDTPGHEAFTTMRERGANVTDIVIIVVAADDGVMPQTAEAISHAKAAEVPIIVAINKIDKPQANIERIKQQLTEYELVSEEWGGSTIFCEVSALKGDGIKELLEQISLQAEILELKANPKRSGMGTIIEARVEKGRGSVASLLVQDGTVRVGDIVAAGLIVGKIRAMSNDRGQRVKEIGPGRPIEITGLSAAPAAGDGFDVCKDEAQAKLLVEARSKKIVASEVPNSKMSLDLLFAKVKSGAVSELPVILKGDVAGSLEAIKSSFEKIATDEVKVKVIHTAVGGVTESDILLASTSGGLVIGFNVRPDTKAQLLAKQKGVEIKCYKIIYELLDEIKKAMGGLLAPDRVESQLGSAEVRETFSVPKMGLIAGSSVVEGKITRGCQVRLVRDSKVVYDGILGSLKRFKDDAKEVIAGYECGLGIENYNDIKVGDIIEAYEVKEVARTLDD